MKKTGWIVAIIVVVFLLAWTFAKAEPEQVSVRLKWNHQAQFAGMYVAEDLGYYKDADLEVTLLEKEQAGLAVSDDVVSGRVDLGIVSLGEFFTALDEGKDLVAIAAFYQTAPSAIASLAGSAISKPEDLKGKVVGISNDDKKSRLLTEVILAKVGLKANDVTFKVVGKKHVQSLLDGTVDAVSTYRTELAYGLDKARVTYNVITPESSGIELYGDILVTSRRYYLNKSKTLAAFTRATLDGWDYALAHKDEAVASTLTRLEGEDVDPEFQKAILDISEPLMRVSGSRGLGYMSPARWDKAYRLYRGVGLVGNLEIYNHFAPAYYFEDVQ